ncbi:MAG: hypothetical protein AABX05_04190 [Nanoarchaeota archaeon]
MDKSEINNKILEILRKSEKVIVKDYLLPHLQGELSEHIVSELEKILGK